MEIKYNGAKIYAITFNGSNVKKAIYNDTPVFCETCRASMSSCASVCKTSFSSGCSFKGTGIFQPDGDVV